MHLYCDESGGTNEDVFLVSAVLLDPAAARRALKSFRKKTGWQGEVKGHVLPAGHRDLLLDLAFKTPGAAAVVVCDARTPQGGWAAKVHGEAALRTDLFTEACVAALADIPGATCSMVTADGGRYTRAVLEQERQRLEAALQAHGLLAAGRRRGVTYGDSQHDPGLQIADVVANAVHRHLLLPETRPELPTAPGSMLLGKWLSVHHVALTSRRPDWLGAPPY